MKTILSNCTIIPCTGGPPMSDMTLTIEGNRIADIANGGFSPPAGIARGNGLQPRPLPDGSRWIDLGGGYLLPGMWEVHAHLGDLIPDPHNFLETEALTDYTIRAGRVAMDGLRAGITGIRCVGEDGYADVAWKRAFDKGVMQGPRLCVCTKGISITGGHGHGTLGALEVDGPWEMRKAVRENLKNGADQIKLMVTGGIMTRGETMEESQFMLDEIQAATEVAHNKGKRVAVHAWGEEGVKTALRGGVDSIEHGFLDDEAIDLILERDAWYIPTVCQTQDVDHINELPKFQIKKAMAATVKHRKSVQKAMQAGVKIACGSDSPPISDFNKRELEFLVKVGMPEMDALIAATRTSADLCGYADDLGTVETGKLADLVVLGSDPLHDISAVRDVRLVIKDGRLVHLDAGEGMSSYADLYF